MDINKVTLIGRLVSAPECSTAASGQRTATFTVATTYTWKETGAKKSDTESHRVVVWGKLAEIAETYLDSGSRVYLEGRLVHSDFTSADVIADEIVLLSTVR